MVFTDTTEGDVAERLWEFPEDWRTAIEVMDVVRLVGPLNGTVTRATAVSAPTPGATIEDDTEGAPNTVNSFVVLARYRFYDGAPFHRIIPGFVIQGDLWALHRAPVARATPSPTNYRRQATIRLGRS